MFLEKYVKKENLGDFILSEYIEKVIIFGFFTVKMREVNIEWFNLYVFLIIYINIGRNI